MELLWFFPNPGGSHYLATSISGRTITPNYLKRLAGVIDALGFTGALLPTGKEAWLTAASLMHITERMKFLVANRPDIASPGAAARIATEYGSSAPTSTVEWVEPVVNGQYLKSKISTIKPVDLYLAWGKPPEQVAEKVAEVQKLAAESGRLLHVIVRETEAEAWDAANQLIQQLDENPTPAWLMDYAEQGID